VTKLNPAGTAVLYQTFLGGTNTDEGYAVAVDEAGSAYITGYTYSTDLATSGAAQSAKGDSVGWSDPFVVKLSPSPLDERAVRVPGHCTCQDHPVSPTPNTIRPVNTRSGNFWTQLTDLALQSPGPALAWTRTYASQAITDTTGVLGYGWQHPYASASVRYGYDAAGRRTQLVYPDSTTLDYEYWADGQLKAVKQGATTLASYTYDTAGRLQTLTRANGATTTYSYDAADRLTDVQTQVGSTTRSRFQYGLDRLGQRTSTTETLAAATRTLTYTYDGLQRLTGATESAGTTYGYGYDLAGNRTGVWLNGTQVVSQSFDAANQVVGWSYDEAGNLLSDGTSQYSYDPMGWLMTASSGGQTRSYAYDADRTLARQATGGSTISYTQDLASPLSQVLQITDGVTTTEHLYGAERLAAVAAGTRTWYGSDGLGSVRQTLSDTGTSLGSVNYDPWGTPESGAVPTFGFTGELQDRWQPDTLNESNFTFLFREPDRSSDPSIYNISPWYQGPDTASVALLPVPINSPPVRRTVVAGAL